jgi:hypothetical protein
MEDIKRIPGFGFQAAIFGGTRGHPFLGDCLEWYRNHHYILPNGEHREFNMQIAPDIYAAIAQKYGFRYEYKLQKLNNNMVILPSTVFPNEIRCATTEAYAIHCAAGTWKSKRSGILSLLAKNNFVRKVFGKEPLRTITDLVENRI